MRFIGLDTMVVGLLSPESPDFQARFNAIRDVAEISLIAAGGSLIPLAAGLFVISELTLWRICSLGLSVVWLVGISAAVMRHRKSGVSPPRRDVGVFIVVGHALLWWNTVSPTGAAAGRYVIALLALLASAGVLFISATFRSRL
jgi:hypothetical protein